jgi:hypothetical protein
MKKTSAREEQILRILCDRSIVSITANQNQPVCGEDVERCRGGSFGTRYRSSVQIIASGQCSLAFGDKSDAAV